MSRIAIAVVATILITGTITRPAFAQEKKADAAAEAAQAAKPTPDATTTPKVQTHKVVAEPLKVEVNLNGVFEAATMEPVLIRPKAWSSFPVEKAVPHGSKVAKGDQLVWLDTSAIDQKLADTKTSLALAKLSQGLADLELELLEKTFPLDLELARRTKANTDEDLLYYLKVGRPQQEKSAKFSLKSSQNSLAYAMEELEQLEKMYEADDLTEESEEIVLKRARNDVERSKYMLESNKLRTKRTLEKSIPREQKSMEDGAKRSEISLARSEASLPAAVEKQELEVAKQQAANARAIEKYKELQGDRAMMKIVAPIDGYVYYGGCKRGKFTGIEAASSQLKQGGKLSANNIFMTIVAIKPMSVRIDVPEKDLGKVRTGLVGKAVPTAFPEMELKSEVAEVSTFPIGSGVFDAKLSVELPEDLTNVVPGMSCKVTLTAFEKKDALTVPASAVFVDDTDGKQDVVYLSGDDGKPTKQKVVIGQKTEKKWEITDGLKAGDEILLKKPEEK